MTKPKEIVSVEHIRHTLWKALKELRGKHYFNVNVQMYANAVRHCLVEMRMKRITEPFSLNDTKIKEVEE